MSDEAPLDVGPAFGALLVSERQMELGPGSPEPSSRKKLEELTIAAAFAGKSLVNHDLANACLAGIWLYFDFLDQSHEISQAIASAEGSFWHAIMHRREPDAGNSKYWWRRVGDHSVLDQLRRLAPAVGYAYSTPFAFVDFVERARGKGNDDERIARQIQLLEWRLLFNHCYRGAVGE